LVQIVQIVQAVQWLAPVNVQSSRFNVSRDCFWLNFTPSRKIHW
jgi:hypothetical protein